MYVYTPVSPVITTKSAVSVAIGRYRPTYWDSLGTYVEEAMLSVGLRNTDPVRETWQNGVELSKERNHNILKGNICTLMALEV